MATTSFEQMIEATSGESIDQIRSTPLDELRAKEEQRRGKPLLFSSTFPFLGRGTVMHDRLVSHQEAERAYENAIDRLPR